MSSVDWNIIRQLVDMGLNGAQVQGAYEVIKGDREGDGEEARERSRKRNRAWRDRLNLSTSDWERLKGDVRVRDDFTCVYCGSRDEPLHIDHVLPLSQGGSNDLSNLVVACRNVTAAKAVARLIQWRGGE